MRPEITATLAPESRSWLRRLGASAIADEGYLAGSAALALYLGHRAASDLDVMSPANRLRAADRRDLLAALLDLDGELRVETARDGLLAARGGDGTGLRFFYYPYPLIDPEEAIDGVTVASAVDLGLMKLGAIISRGTRRDFVDLYLLTRRLPLATLLDRAHEKFGHVEDFPLQALKGLADFSLTEGEPTPSLTVDLDWPQIRATLEDEVRAEASRRLGVVGAEQSG